MDGAAAAATGMVSSVALRTGSSGAGREGTPSLLGSPPGLYSGLLHCHQEQEKEHHQTQYPPKQYFSNLARAFHFVKL